MTQVHLLAVGAVALGWVLFFVYRGAVKKGGGFAALARAQLNERFRLPQGEQVTAAWNADTIPKLSAAEKVAGVVGAAASVAGLGFEFVGRPLGIACTTRNRLLVLDREEDAIQVFEPRERPRITDSGKKGKRRPSQTRVGWEEGAVVVLEVPGEAPLELDLPAEAAAALVGWSHGGDLSARNGPYPAKGAI